MLRRKTRLPGLLAASLVTLAALPAAADPALFVGVSLRFGGDAPVSPGLTLKVLSSDREDEGVLAAGIGWYPKSSQPWGLDVSAGYAFDSGAALIGYDFLSASPVFSLGWADTDDKKHHDDTVDDTPPDDEGGGET